MAIRLNGRQVAELEEQRQSLATADVSDASEPIAGGTMSFSGPGSWTNQASGLGMDGPVSNSDLDRLDAFYVSRGVEPTVQVATHADPTLSLALTARGYTVRGYEHVMARFLVGLPDEDTLLAFGGPQDIDILSVDARDPAEVETYIDASTVGFRPAKAPVPEPLAIATRRQVQHPRYRCFLASTTAGRPVGGGMLEIAGELACLCGTSVALAFRRRGIHQSLIVRRLVTARDAGAHIAVIDSEPGGTTERNAQLFGFDVVYTKVLFARPLDGLPPTP